MRKGRKKVRTQERMVKHGIDIGHIDTKNDHGIALLD